MNVGDFLNVQISEIEGPVIDAHVNVGLYPLYPGGMSASTLEESEKRLSAYLKRYNIRGAWICSFESLYYDSHQGNEMLMSCCDDKDYKLFATVHPYHESKALAELRTLKERGFFGLKLHPAIQSFNPNTTCALKIVSEADRCGLPIMVHTGSNAGVTKPDNYLKMIKSVRVPFIMAHIGQSLLERAVDLAEKYDHVFLETSLCRSGMESLRYIIDRIGYNRILFGSDFPCGDHQVEIFKIISQKLSDVERLSIMGKNALGIQEIFG